MSYQPTFPGEGVTPQWIYDELQRIGTAISNPGTIVLDELNAEPTRPQEPMIVFADGTNWNPGGGRGVYVWYTAAWHKL